jgi:hypothetical protein
MNLVFVVIQAPDYCLEHHLLIFLTQLTALSMTQIKERPLIGYVSVDGVVWIGLVWIRIGTSGELL